MTLTASYFSIVEEMTDFNFVRFRKLIRTREPHASIITQEEENGERLCVR